MARSRHVSLSLQLTQTSQHKFLLVVGVFHYLQSWDSTAPDYLLFPTAEDTTHCECLVLVEYCCQPNWLPSFQQPFYNSCDPGTGADVTDLLERGSLLTISDSSLATFAAVCSADLNKIFHFLRTRLRCKLFSAKRHDFRQIHVVF